MSVTPNRGIPLMEPSQSEPEVVYNAAMEVLDVAETLEVEQLGSSPGVRGVTKIKFSGASVTDLGGGMIEVTVDMVTGAGGGSLELTDGTHDLTGVTKITVVGLTVGGTAGAATLTASGAAAGTGASLKTSVTFSIPDSVDTPISWNTAIFDTGGYYSGAHPTRLTAPATGLYHVDASVYWDNHSTTNGRYIAFMVNGAGGNRIAICIIPSPVSAFTFSSNTSALLSLTAGDYVEVVAFQNSGAAMNVLNGETFSTFSMAGI